jgi:hypothetical protein
MKTNPNQPHWRGRAYNAQMDYWEFSDGSGTIITNDARLLEIDSLRTQQQDNMEYARRLFSPSEFHKR